MRLFPLLFTIGMPKKKFYAVTAGREIGIFSSWDECQKQVGTNTELRG
jgi:hypothetical protein